MYNVIFFIIGVYITIIFYSFPFTDNAKAQKALYNCESSLPRNKNCKIIAVPEDFP